jgi:hypothetical protein
MSDVWDNLPVNASVARLKMLIDIDEVKDWRDWNAAPNL